MNVIDQVKLMYDEGLYTNVAGLVNLLISISEQNPEFVGVQAKYQLMVYYADSLYHLKEYRKAENIYRKALQLKKSLLKIKGKTPSSSQIPLPSEVDVKYQIHLCHCQLKQFALAITVLESIPGKRRTARVNMALAQLYQQGGMERSAITGYKEVLKECPLALEAALGLLSLGVKGAEVASLMLTATSVMPNMEWLSTWIKAYAHFNAKEFPQAAATLRQLDGRSCLRDNINMLVTLGDAYFNAGEYKHCLSVLQRVHFLDPFCFHGMDVLASLLYKEKRYKELENLAIQMISVAEHAAESWVAMTYSVSTVKSASKAIYYVTKAILIDPRNVEAHILKGNLLLEMKKWQEALFHYREALTIIPHRFEAHQGLVSCYIPLHRNREAITIASNACKHLGQTPRTLTLYASVLAKDALSIDRAQALLEKALALEPTNLDAVYLLAELYEQQQLFEKGIELLSSQIKIQSGPRLHQMLAEFYRRNNEHEKALEHFSASLSLDRTNLRAIEGIQRLEQHPDGLATNYSVEVEDVPETDNEGDVEESEVEAVWSDMDFT